MNCSWCMHRTIPVHLSSWNEIITLFPFSLVTLVPICDSFNLFYALEMHIRYTIGAPCSTPASFLLLECFYLAHCSKWFNVLPQLSGLLVISQDLSCKLRENCCNSQTTSYEVQTEIVYILVMLLMHHLLYKSSKRFSSFISPTNSISLCLYVNANKYKNCVFVVTFCLGLFVWVTAPMENCFILYPQTAPIYLFKSSSPVCPCL